MDFISVFNDVMGPVMRGPSSSHTAGAYRIATVARSLLGEAPASVELAFDPDGSYAPTYEACGVDLASISALLGVPMTDERFCDARELAAAEGVDVQFAVRSLADADHPNYVEIAMTGRTGARLQCAAKSVGGGAIVVSRIEGWPVELTGKAHEVLVECSADCAAAVSDKLTSGAATPEAPQVQARGDRRLVCASLGSPLSSGLRSELAAIPGVERIWAVESVFHVRRGEPIFGSAAEMVELAQARGVSLGRLALEYECELLGLTEADALKEMMARYEVMKRSVQAGLAEQDLRLKLLQPTARRIMEAESQGKTALGGAHTRAAARAMAVMHVSNSMGIVCAAPTGGAAGTIPGVVTTLAAERALSAEQIALSLFAASAIGLIVALRATFAAETAGCQVEVTAAGAMAAAAVVEAAGGSARHAVDAAAITFHNSMGLVCDTVQGRCEIPCHTRNAVAASSAFACADLVMGGYENPIPLDDTVDAVLAVGGMLPAELRCTSRGGIAVTPSARALPGAR